MCRLCGSGASATSFVGPIIPVLAKCTLLLCLTGVTIGILYVCISILFSSTHTRRCCVSSNNNPLCVTCVLPGKFCQRKMNLVLMTLSITTSVIAELRI